MYQVSPRRLVAQAFPKFFNMGELAVSKQRNLLKKTDYTCYEKLDGSLGILYYYDGEWQVNTRGSFSSEQAIEAKKMIDEQYFFKEYRTHFTLLVEIIYPENRIIIDYKDQRKLVLLAGYNPSSKVELDRTLLEEISRMTGMPLVKEYKKTFDEMFEFRKSNDLTIEGYVVRFANGERVKIKSKRYLNIARVLSNLTPLALWKCMENGKVRNKDLEQVPEEFQKEIQQIVYKLQMNYLFLSQEIYNEFWNVYGNSRKKIGLSDAKHKGAIFSILDDKLDKLDNYIMKQIRPKGDENGV